MLGVVGALALAGGVIAALQLVQGAPLEGVVREPSAGGTWEVTSGFGPVSVERVQRVTGSLHGGHLGLGDTRQDELRVRLTLGNRLDRPVPYSPGQVRLRQAVSGTTTSPLDPSEGRTSIGPGQTVHRDIAFLVPEGSTRISLTVDDLMSPRPLAIDLGTVPSP